MKFILARKLNMTQLFTEEGRVVPVTVLEAAGCRITMVKTPKRDGYQAVQVALGKNRREFRISEEKPYKVGEEIKVSVFEPGDIVDVAGLTKGRGFTGAVKRHGFHGAPKSHGHDHPRAVGAIGQRFPQHVRPGLRMAGRDGGGQATVQNTVVVAVAPEKNLLFVKGGVPGAPKGLLRVVSKGKAKNIPNVFAFQAAQTKPEPAAKPVKPAEKEKEKHGTPNL